MKFSDIEARIGTEISSGRIPGLACGIVDGDRLIWSRGFGRMSLAHTDPERTDPPDNHTLFRVASITKTFTAAAVLQLRDAGKLRLDDPLTCYIPEFADVRVRAGNLPGVTLRRLLTHHSGLSTETPLPTWDALVFPAMNAVLAAMHETEVVIPQDSAFKYSNLGFGLLGEVIARVSGMPYFEYIARNLFVPLGMTDSVFELSDTTSGRLATGYIREIFADQFVPAPDVVLNGLAACGQLYSSVADLARWISAQLPVEPQFGGSSGVLCRATIDELHRPQYLEPDWSVGYCPGWRANRFGNEVFHGHGGGIHGYSSQILFSKKSRVGVICLANVWPHAGILQLAADLLTLAIAARPEVSRTNPGHPTLPQEWRCWLGDYTTFPQIMLRVAWRNGQLRIEPTPGSDYYLHVPANLEHIAEATFLVRGGRGSGETIRFSGCPADGGAATRISFSLGGFVYHRSCAAQ